MKFLFVVQGEGRGHLTQAITLEEMLTRNGHEVVEILVGESSSRILPGYFNRNVQAPVKRFLSPRFFAAKDDKRSHLRKSVLHNLLAVPEYVRSMYYIHRRIRQSNADVVVNFYEVLTGLTYLFLRPSVPYVSVGHQYSFLHKDFNFPDKTPVRLLLLRLFTRLTSLRAAKRLALTFRALSADPQNNVVSVPPLLRREVTAIQPEPGNYIHGYLLNTGFADEVAAFHRQHPGLPLQFFWDNPDADEVTEVDATLRYHQLDDAKFLNGMAGCCAYACTAGFESICEAMYLGKPVLMVPAHIEQDCNAYDAAQAGAGIVSDSFNLDALLTFAGSYVPDREFVYWVRSAERLVVSELESCFESPNRSVATEIFAFR